jgi:hypothetical protein
VRILRGTECLSDLLEKIENIKYKIENLMQENIYIRKD